MVTDLGARSLEFSWCNSIMSYFCFSGMHYNQAEKTILTTPLNMNQLYGKIK